ncbi:hypothetical protein TWF730_005824 [Orbilia blumenaviensis]|uniref:F-box domain-containing protein n=1 Tax=Orbilia blumenaviensis TaxID=1796055 RepID=A0AAV9VKW5_9PEZI
MNTPVPMATLAALPVELHVEIQSYLSNIDIERLSQCSRSLRSISLPQVFRSARISPESLRFFEDAGILQRLYSCVRYITVKLDLNNDITALLTSIAPFTRLTSLKLSYTVAHSSRAPTCPLFTAIFSKIYTYPFFPFLKTISLTVRQAPQENTYPQDINITGNPPSPSIPPEDVATYPPGNIINIPTLQSAKLKLLFNNSIFSFDQLPTFYTHFNIIINNNSNSNPTSIFCLPRSCSATLKTLHLHVSNILLPDTITTAINFNAAAAAEDEYRSHRDYTTYPTTTELHITLSSLTRIHLRDLTRRFRNLKVFIVKETNPGEYSWDQEGARPFKDIVRMTKLKTLWLPWVMMRRGKAAKWKLERSVMYWVSHGLEDLEDICFQERVVCDDENGERAEGTKVVGAWVLEKTPSGNFHGTYHS